MKDKIEIQLRKDIEEQINIAEELSQRINEETNELTKAKLRSKKEWVEKKSLELSSEFFGYKRGKGIALTDELYLLQNIQKRIKKEKGMVDWIKYGDYGIDVRIKYIKLILREMTK